MSKVARTLHGSIAITKLPSVIVKKTKKGNLSVQFPIEANNLVQGKENAVYIPIKILLWNEEDQYKSHGMIALNPPSVNGKKWKECSEDEKELFKAASPALGNVKDFEFTRSDGPADQNVYSEEDDDDLPF